MTARRRATKAPAMSAAVQTARSKLGGRVDLAVRGSTHGATLPPATLAVLVSAIRSAIADYDVRASWYPHIPVAQKSAGLFAEKIAALTRTLDRAIVRRTHRGGRTVTIGASPENLFTITAQRWIPTLRQWRAAAEAERTRWPVPKGRPPDEARLRLECAVAAALDAAGIRPTTTKTGVFARVLAAAIYPAVGLDGADEQTAVRSAIKALPAWRTLPRAGKLHP